jgi:hypothetical protein
MADIFASYGLGGERSLGNLRSKTTFTSAAVSATTPASGAISFSSFQNKYTLNPAPVTGLIITTWPPNNLPANKPPRLKFSLDMRGGGGRGGAGGFRSWNTWYPYWNGGSGAGSGGRGGFIRTAQITLASPSAFPGDIRNISPRGGYTYTDANGNAIIDGETVHFFYGATFEQALILGMGTLYSAGGGGGCGRGDGNGGQGGFTRAQNGNTEVNSPGTSNYHVGGEAGSGGQGQSGETSGGGWQEGRPTDGLAGYVAINLYYV